MKIFKKIAGIFFPAHCLACEGIISKEALFCSACWPKLQFITNPKCKICSYPFEFEMENSDAVCAKCVMDRPAYDKVFAIFRYNKIMRKAVGDLKYRDSTFLAKKFAKILFEKTQGKIDADLIIAVPLHPKRLRKRKFNQAVLLGKSLGKNLGMEFFPDILRRVFDTQPQVELRKKDREKNLKNAFAVNEKYCELVKGKKILLIDDVMTTGATISSCAGVLKKAGAKKVCVLVIAKTVFGTMDRS